MTQAFATRIPRGFSWVWMAIMVVALTSSPLHAQAPPKDDPKPRANNVNAEKKDDEAAPPPVEQVFTDTNVKKALTVFNQLNFVGQPIRIGVQGDDRSKMGSMVGRLQNTDPDFIKRYIEFFAVELTRKDNLNAILNPSPTQKPNDRPARGLEAAVDALTKPVIDAQAGANLEFLTLYYRLLFESILPKLVESNHNYLTRIDAAIVLGMAGHPSPAALNFYIEQIKKPDQLVWVKLWAARGLTIASQQGEIPIEAAKANQAAEGLIGVLDGDPKLPWPVTMRILEALGSLRVAIATTSKGRLDVASVVMRFLADPDAQPIVRSWAAWSLGMVKVPSNVTPYNFTLVGQEIGELAVELGSRIVREYDDNPVNFDKNKDEATRLASLLIFQVCPAMIGMEKSSDSGLLRSPHESALKARPFLTKVDEKVKAVSREAYELIRAVANGNKTARDQLDAKLADLKTTLDGSSPKDRHLVPGGPEFSVKSADFRVKPAEQVAGAQRH